MKTTQSSLISFIQFFIGWPLAILAVFYLLQIIFSKGSVVASHLINLDIESLVIAFVFFFMFYCIRAMLWHKILLHQGYRIPLIETFYYWGFSELKRFVPGNIWSFLGRGIAFSKLGMSKGDITRSILYELEFFLIACFIVSLLGLPFIYRINSFSIPNQHITIVAIVIILAMITIFLFSNFSHFKNNSLLFRVRRNILPQQTPFSIASLLLLSCCSLICFGLGTYFSITSLYFLTPVLLWQYVGFFVIALLIGYLSFITPMGLGVREGIITLGLSPILGIPQAGLAAILARIVLIFSEMGFLLLAFIWKHASNTVKNLSQLFIKKYLVEIILFIFIIGYTLYFTTASFLRFENYYTGRFDLGNMDQTVWNSIHGRLFSFTDPNGVETISRLAFHADFILVLLSPLYLLWEDPRMLLLTQTLMLAFGAFFVYKISLHILQNKHLSLTFSFAFLINPSVGYTNLYDFHAVVFATTFLLASYFFLQQKKSILFVAFALLAGLTKEHVWLITAFLGVYAIFFQKVKFAGTSLAVISVTLFYVLIWHVIPAARGEEHFAISYYAEFGDSPTSIIKSTVASPLKTFNILFQSDRINYQHQLFAPLGYLPLFAPHMLIFSFPDLFINLLSSNDNLHQIFYQYTATITPFLFIAAIYGVKFLTKIFPVISLRTYIFYLLITAVFSAYSFGPLPGAKKPNLDMFTKPLENKLLIETVIENIGQNEKIAATNNLGSHLSEREYIYTIPLGINQADTILFLVNEPRSWPSTTNLKDLIIDLKQNKQFILTIENNNFTVFRKNTNFKVDNQL